MLISLATHDYLTNILSENLQIQQINDFGFYQVGLFSLVSPLPPEWKMIESSTGTHRWINTQTKEETDVNPMDAYFIELRNRRRIFIQ